MNVQMLKNIPVWEKQRVYRKERAKKIADSYLSKNREADEPITIPGTIAIYEKGWETPKYHLEALREVGSVNVERSKRQQTNKVKESLKEARSRYGIIDGQHRVGLEDAKRVLLSHVQGGDPRHIDLDLGVPFRPHDVLAAH